jgi:hypothetical protein
VDLSTAAVERESGGDVQQLVAQPFRFGFGELAVDYECLGPDDQVVCEEHDLQPYLVERELLERELLKAGVLVVADAVLDARALAVAALEDVDVVVGLVGQDRLEAISVVVGEGELRAGVRTLAPDDHPGPVRPGAEIESVGDLHDVAVLPFGSGLVERGDPGAAAGFEDRGPDRLGQLVPAREPQVLLRAVLGGRVRRAGRVGPDQDLEVLDVLGRELRDRGRSPSRDRRRCSTRRSRRAASSRAPPGSRSPTRRADGTRSRACSFRPRSPSPNAL